MRKLLTHIHFKLTPEDLDITRNEFFLANIQRWKIYLWIAVPLSLLHIVLFAVNLDPSNPVEYTWRKQIILMHSILILLALAFGLYAYLAGRRKIIANRIDLAMGPLFCLLLMVSGAIISGIDQQVTVAITPFLVVCIVPALILVIRPVFLISINLASYFLFIFLIRRAQENPDIVLSDMVNGLTAIGLSVGLSIILWRSGIIRHRQNRLITKQQNALEASYLKLRESSEELEKVNATKDRFFSIIAHDLFGPLSGISSYLEVMAEDPQSGSGDRASIMASINRFRDSVDNTLRLIENLLNWARNQQNEISFNPKPIDVVALLGESVETLRPQFEKKNITVHITDEAPVLMVNGDVNMLDTVFRNLLSNAIKFSNAGSDIRIALETTNNLVLIRFIDHGVGISPAAMEKLFKVGEKITSRGTEREPGTGLGLILCREFITHHNGQILVESEQGAGSIFTVELPVIPKIVTRDA